MAESQFYAILTDQGAALEATALATGIPVTLDKFVIGDGGGNAVTPDPTRTTLVNEVYRGTIQKAESQDNQVTFTLHVPPEAGGYTIREAGILTADGTLYSLSNSPDILKPTESNGAVISITFKYILAVSSTSTVNVNVINNEGISQADADKLYYRRDKRLSEIKDEGVEAQKETQLNIGIDLGEYYTKNDVDSKFEGIESEINNSNPVLSVNDIKPDDKGNVNTASGYPLPDGDGAFNLVSVFATATYLSVMSGCDLSATSLSNTTGSGDAIMSLSHWLPGIWRMLVSINKSTNIGGVSSGAGMAQRIPVGSISKFENIKNPFYPYVQGGVGNVNTNYICFECDIDGVGTGITFASCKYDVEDYGRQLYENALSGMYGVVANGN
ncbi:phage tail protein [Salmonella enterica subsp. enterica]|nr:phage tail protein [Salmonella enterica subsp. enterica serovar Telelkebir]EDS4703402.1 phage tail protein [Salmonella enterica]EDV3146422.1 phage tail protein [Salmonella enterica subsp. enterica]EBS3086660.1 phage tail protein [Salmonella enterica subsp. enterica serovar Telelkebir]EEA9904939.1 phage tail protein [Salmonella enterica subsp. enterica serovar Telelkebir]